MNASFAFRGSASQRAFWGGFVDGLLLALRASTDGRDPWAGFALGAAAGALAQSQHRIRDRKRMNERNVRIAEAFLSALPKASLPRPPGVVLAPVPPWPTVASAWPRASIQPPRLISPGFNVNKPPFGAGGY